MKGMRPAAAMSRAMRGNYPRRMSAASSRIPVRITIGVLLLLAAMSQVTVSQETESPPPNGAAIFSQRCATCHGTSGEGVSAVVTIAGPSLQAEHDRGAVITAMEVGPSHMPNFSYVLSLREIQAVADYVTQQIAVIPLTGGNLSEGGKLFRVNCAPCHRTAVRGGALAFTDVNAPALTGTSAAIIAGAIRWGTGPMPSFKPAVLNDKQVASIVEYVQFVQHPPHPGGGSLNYSGPVAEGFVAWVFLMVLVAITGWIESGGKG